MSHVFLYDSVKNELAEKTAAKLRPEIDRLKKDFTGVSAQQQAQLDRIEGQLAELLSLLKPDELSKPSLLKKTAGQKP